MTRFNQAVDMPEMISDQILIRLPKTAAALAELVKNAKESDLPRLDRATEPRKE